MRGLLAGAILLAATAALAQPRDEDKAAADRLFEEGRTLLAGGQRKQACDKFEQSFRMDPRAVGTMLNLAQCHEMTGEVATAVRYYEEARDRAHDQSLNEHQQAAERRLALLAPRVPHLVVTGVPASAKVIVDTAVLAADQLAGYAIDPGTRAITVTQPGKLPYETKVILAEGERKVVAIPALEGARTVVVETSSRRLYGKVSVGGGAALGAISLGLALYARHLYWDQFPAASRDGMDGHDLLHDCFTINGNVACNTAGQAATHNARVLSGVATGVGIAGAVALAAGAYLWWTAPVTVDVDRDRASVAITARF